MRPFLAWSLLVALALALGVLIGAALMQRSAERRESQLARARNVRGKRGEQRAIALLEAAGYRIVAEQQRFQYLVQADAREVAVGLSFDFVVERDGEQLVAEVKTGGTRTQLKHAETRRQLLEYQLASGGHRVLLVDPEKERITEVRFPISGAVVTAKPKRQRELRWGFLAAWLATLVAVLWLTLKWR